MSNTKNIEKIYRIQNDEIVPMYLGWLQYLESIGIFRSAEPNKLEYLYNRGLTDFVVIDIRDAKELVYSDILNSDLNNYGAVLEMVIEYSNKLFSPATLDYLDTI
ncbi:hypothetical protein [Maribacter sp. 2307UL18-2]|uniref:hypothetical protein n=1 Tax=Maribacter sp. 2307UL18-2 TaxID=3386274 RepID=UPI0039BC5449